MSTLSRKLLMIKPDYAFYSIGMAYVAAGLRKSDIEYDWFDAHLDPRSELQRMLEQNDYLAVATGGLIGSFTFFRTLFDEVKARKPSMPCILGGNITHALRPRQLFHYFPVDFLVIGEGEHSLPELLAELDRGERAPRDVAGIAFRDPIHPEEIIRTHPRPRLDLSQENWIPHWDPKTMERYQVTAFPLLSGRGCTGRCTFCAPTNGRFRGRPLEHVLEEMNFLNEHFDFGAYNFLNEILFDDARDIERFCDEYEKLKIRKKWNCLLRVDLDPHIIKRMKEAGLWAVNIGIESGSDRVLKRIQKDTTVAQIRAFVNALRENQIFIEGSFMLGNLDEGSEDMEATIRLMHELNVVGPMALTINYPGTYNYRLANERGLIIDEEAYIRSLDQLYGVDPFDVMTRHRSGELNYLNLSALPDDAFFEHVETNIRRYATDHFSVRNGVIQQTENPQILLLSGDCPFCGNHLQVRFELESFAISQLRMPDCTLCGVREIYFNPRCIPQFETHFQQVAERIEKSTRIALLGQSGDIRWVLKHDHFNLAQSRIAGIIQHDAFHEAFAANHAAQSWETLMQAGMDLVLVLNSIPMDLLQQCFLERVGWDRILFLTPSAFASAMQGRPSPEKALEFAFALGLSRSPDIPDLRRYQQRIQNLLPAWQAQQTRVLIHGAGPLTDLLLGLPEIKMANIVGISDRNPYLRGKSKHGFQILGFDEIAKVHPDVIILASVSHQEEMRKNLDFLHQQGVELVGF